MSEKPDLTTTEGVLDWMREVAFESSEHGYYDRTTAATIARAMFLLKEIEARCEIGNTKFNYRPGAASCHAVLDILAAADAEGQDG